MTPSAVGPGAQADVFVGGPGGINGNVGAAGAGGNAGYKGNHG